MSEHDKAIAGSRQKKIRSTEEKLAGHWLISLLKNRRRETAAAIIILMLAVAVYDSGDTKEDAASDEVLGNIEDLLGGFETDSEKSGETNRLADSDNSGLTIPLENQAGLMDPFDALHIPREADANDAGPGYGQPESITSLSNDPIQITPASSRRAEEESDAMDFDSAFPVADQTTQPQAAPAPQVRLTGTIEPLN